MAGESSFGGREANAMEGRCASRPLREMPSKGILSQSIHVSKEASWLIATMTDAPCVSPS